MSELTKRDITKLQNSVLRGVKLLDRTDADWWRKKNGTVFPGSIDETQLDLGNTEACVLGQLDRGYVEGATRLFPRADSGLYDVFKTARHGFTLHDGEPNQAWGLLTEFWLAVILARRNPRRKRPEWLAKKAYV